MKALYLTGSIICTVLILVLAFGNISAQCSGMYFFFYQVKSNPTIVTISIAFLGIITGALYHAFFAATMSTDEDPDQEGF